MNRRIATSMAVLVTAAALVAAACTPGPVPTATWKVKPSTIKVISQSDWADMGDEPYVIQIGFRSKLGVANSSDAFISSQCYAGQLPAPDAAPAGSTISVPPGSADITFPDVQNLDLLDVLTNAAPFEIFGTLSFVMERNGIFPTCAMSDAFNNALVPALRDALNLLIAANPVPPTQEQLVSLIVNNLGNFLQSAANFVLAILEGLGTPDAVVGTVAQIHLPTKGALADLLNAGLAIAGLLTGQITADGQINVPGLPPAMKVRVGNLLPSTATFDLPGSPGHYVYTSTIG